MLDHAPKPARFRHSLRGFGRHQLSAFLTTCADFSAMTLAHELFGINPVRATIVGATLGGMVNFQLGRRWVFGARQGAVWIQAARYAAVSLGCVILNTSGMALLSIWFGSSAYLLQRAAVSIAVSMLWSYPAQRWLVFNVRAGANARAAGHAAELVDSAKPALHEP